MEEEKSIDEEKIRVIVREEYGKVANRARVSSCCGPSTEVNSPQSSSCGADSCGGAISIPADKLDDFLKKYSAQLGYDEEDDLLVLVAREIEETDDGLQEASVARFWCTRSQLRASCKWGLEVASRGRPICGNCGQPRDPEGHFCPKSNGHKT